MAPPGGEIYSPFRLIAVTSNSRLGKISKKSPIPDFLEILSLIAVLEIKSGGY